jgi:hypothetical protein
MDYLKENWQIVIEWFWRLMISVILAAIVAHSTKTYNVVDVTSHMVDNSTNTIETKLDQIYAKVSEQSKSEPQVQQSCPEPKDSFYQHAEDIKNFVEVLDPVFLQHPTMIQIVELLSLSEGKVDPNVFKGIIPVP